ncbi:DUF1269 domain-containing protein [Enterococcus nangangensis]|uniref:DUF1269 domain-containing protein n=1 Tax=Enterococcus nangangensis TaxID=2559926 RepID=UPI0010F760B6|nr:DUF1269 domain-containing protein [Enterococcus nangangensis]
MKKVIILDFDAEAKNYQAFSEIKKLVASGALKGEQMAVVQQKTDGSHTFTIEDFIDFTGQNKTAKSSMIGSIIGIFGAGLPGMLIGWLTGSVIGSVQDAKEIRLAKTIFEHVNDQIHEGETGVVLIADEEDNRPLNQLIMGELGGQINRLDFADVMASIEAAKKEPTATSDAAAKK